MIEFKRAAPKIGVNLSISTDSISEAKTLKINLSRAAQKGIDEAIRETKAQQWQKENREAIAAYNERIDREGPTLAHYRTF